MATGLEIVVGTYEEFLLGYRVRLSRNSPTRKYDLYQSFSTHSHTSSIRTLASSGDLVASGGADDRICVYDLKKRRENNELYIHEGTVNTLAFAPDGSYLISGGTDGKIVFTKTTNWKVDKEFEKAHKGSSVNYISLHPSGKLALSIGSDMTLRTWNLINGRQAFATSLKNKSLGYIDFVMWSTSGDYFAITGKDSVEVWDTKQASVVASKKCDARPTSLCWISDSDLLIGMEDGKMMFFNWEDENEEATICEIYDNRIKAMKFLDGFLATASSSGELNLWKISSGDKTEIEMIAGVDVGCRLICLELVELSTFGNQSEIKYEDEQEAKKTQVRQLVTSGSVIVEVEDETVKKKTFNKRKSLIKPQRFVEGSKKQKRKSVRLSNGFVEEDC